MDASVTLVVGDDTAFLAKTRSSLEGRGHSIISAASGEAVTRLADSQRIDLVVLKLDPSKKDTQDIIEILRKRGLTGKKIITISTEENINNTSVDQIESAIHAARVRVLSRMAQRDFVLGILSVIGIGIVALFSGSPAVKFLGVFWITLLAGEFAHYKILSRNR